MEKKRPGRPRLGPRKRSARLVVALSPAELEKVKACARDAHLSVPDFIRWKLERELQND
jgi:hypothetical protein